MSTKSSSLCRSYIQQELDEHSSSSSESGESPTGGYMLDELYDHQVLISSADIETVEIPVDDGFMAVSIVDCLVDGDDGDYFVAFDDAGTYEDYVGGSINYVMNDDTNNCFLKPTTPPFVNNIDTTNQQLDFPSSSQQTAPSDSILEVTRSRNDSFSFLSTDDDLNLLNSSAGFGPDVEALTNDIMANDLQMYSNSETVTSDDMELSENNFADFLNSDNCGSVEVCEESIAEGGDVIVGGPIQSLPDESDAESEFQGQVNNTNVDLVSQSIPDRVSRNSTRLTAPKSRGRPTKLRSSTPDVNLVRSSISRTEVTNKEDELVDVVHHDHDYSPTKISQEFRITTDAEARTVISEGSCARTTIIKSKKQKQSNKGRPAGKNLSLIKPHTSKTGGNVSSPKKYGLGICRKGIRYDDKPSDPESSETSESSEISYNTDCKLIDDIYRKSNLDDKPTDPEASEASENGYNTDCKLIDEIYRKRNLTDSPVKPSRSAASESSVRCALNDLIKSNSSFVLDQTDQGVAAPQPSSELDGLLSGFTKSEYEQVEELNASDSLDPDLDSAIPDDLDSYMASRQGMIDTGIAQALKEMSAAEENIKKMNQKSTKQGAAKKSKEIDKKSSIESEKKGSKSESDNTFQSKEVIKGDVKKSNSRKQEKNRKTEENSKESKNLPEVNNSKPNKLNNNKSGNKRENEVEIKKVRKMSVEKLPDSVDVSLSEQKKEEFRNKARMISSLIKGSKGGSKDINVKVNAEKKDNGSKMNTSESESSKVQQPSNFDVSKDGSSKIKAVKNNDAQEMKTSELEGFKVKTREATELTISEISKVKPESNADIISQVVQIEYKSMVNEIKSENIMKVENEMLNDSSVSIELLLDNANVNENNNEVDICNVDDKINDIIQEIVLVKPEEFSDSSFETATPIKKRHKFDDYLRASKSLKLSKSPEKTEPNNQSVKVEDKPLISSVSLPCILPIVENTSIDKNPEDRRNVELSTKPEMSKLARNDAENRDKGTSGASLKPNKSASALNEIYSMFKVNTPETLKSTSSDVKTGIRKSSDVALKLNKAVSVVNQVRSMDKVSNCSLSAQESKSKIDVSEQRADDHNYSCKPTDQPIKPIESSKSPTIVNHEPQKTSVLVKPEPQKTTASIKHEPQKTSAPMKHEPQKTTAYIKPEPQKTSASVKHEPQKSLLLINQEPQKLSGSVKQEAQKLSSSSSRQARSDDMTPQSVLEKAYGSMYSSTDGGYSQKPGMKNLKRSSPQNQDVSGDVKKVKQPETTSSVTSFTVKSRSALLKEKLSVWNRPKIEKISATNSGVIKSSAVNGDAIKSTEASEGSSVGVATRINKTTSALESQPTSTKSVSESIPPPIINAPPTTLNFYDPKVPPPPILYSYIPPPVVYQYYQAGPPPFYHPIPSMSIPPPYPLPPPPCTSTRLPAPPSRNLYGPPTIPPPLPVFPPAAHFGVPYSAAEVVIEPCTSAGESSVSSPLPDTIKFETCPPPLPEEEVLTTLPDDNPPPPPPPMEDGELCQEGQDEEQICDSSIIMIPDETSVVALPERNIREQSISSGIATSSTRVFSQAEKKKFKPTKSRSRKYREKSESETESEVSEPRSRSSSCSSRSTLSARSRSRDRRSWKKNEREDLYGDYQPERDRYKSRGESSHRHRSRSRRHRSRSRSSRRRSQSRERRHRRRSSRESYDRYDSHCDHSYDRSSGRRYEERGWGEGEWRRGDRGRNNRDIDKEKKEEEKRQKTVYIGGLPNDMLANTLRNALSSFGKTTKASIHVRDEKQGDNYGFVDFETPQDASKCLALGNTLPGFENCVFCFGDRKGFVKAAYSDLDGQDANGRRREDRQEDFASLLKRTLSSLGR